METSGNALALREQKWKHLVNALSCRELMLTCFECYICECGCTSAEEARAGERENMSKTKIISTYFTLNVAS